MRFDDARAAGRALAEGLEASYGGRRRTSVLGVARGGAGVAAEVSRRLGLPLDLLFLRRLLVPRGPLHPACAASVAGSLFLDEEVAAALSGEAPDAPLRQFLDAAVGELDSLARACRGERAAPDLGGQTVILVDNGVRTGSTMLAAIRALRSQTPARVVAAAPVADASACDAVRAAVEEFHTLATPDPFGHVGLWYKDFRRASGEELRAMLGEGAKDEVTAD